MILNETYFYYILITTAFGSACVGYLLGSHKGFLSRIKWSVRRKKRVKEKLVFINVDDLKEESKK